MKENNLRKVWESGGCVINGWLSIPSGFAAEVMAHGVGELKWDTLTVDMQHGVQDYQSTVSCFQAIATTNVTPMVRVPWLDEGIIMKSLDAGALGLICPMINTGEEARRLVQACRYPPLGQRSSGPIRAGFYGPDYQKTANENIVVLAMIETREAYDNLDAIFSTPGLDGIYIGPSDLSLSLTGRPGFDHAEGTVQYETIMRILEKCREYGLKAGIHTGAADYAAKMREAGFHLTTVGSDMRMMLLGMKNELEKLREKKGEVKKRPY